MDKFLLWFDILAGAMGKFLPWVGIVVGAALAILSARPWGIWEGRLIDQADSWSWPLTMWALKYHTLGMVMYILGFVVMMISASHFLTARQLSIVLVLVAVSWEVLELVQAMFSAAKSDSLPVFWDLKTVGLILLITLSVSGVVLSFRALGSHLGLE